MDLKQGESGDGDAPPGDSADSIVARFARAAVNVWRRISGDGPLFGYMSPAGRHRHRCPECGTVWEHDDPPPMKSPLPGRHTCPNAACPTAGAGRPCRERYYGPEPPTAGCSG